MTGIFGSPLLTPPSSAVICKAMSLFIKLFDNLYNSLYVRKIHFVIQGKPENTVTDFICDTHSPDGPAISPARRRGMQRDIMENGQDTAFTKTPDQHRAFFNIVCNNIKHISDLSGFPTMRYISGRGNIVENYENDRSIDSFIKWIDSKHGNFVDKTPSISSSVHSRSITPLSRRIAQGRRRRRNRKTFQSMRRNKHKHTRRMPQNTGRKLRHKRNSTRSK